MDTRRLCGSWHLPPDSLIVKCRCGCLSACLQKGSGWHLSPIVTFHLHSVIILQDLLINSNTQLLSDTFRHSYCPKLSLLKLSQIWQKILTSWSPWCARPCTHTTEATQVIITCSYSILTPLQFNLLIGINGKGHVWVMNQSASNLSSGNFL